METSIYLEKSLVRKVRAASASSGLSIRSIIGNTAKHIVSSVRFRSSRIGALYQSFPETVVHREFFHISLPNNLYEQCTDMRKVCKKSVSRLFAEALTEHLNDIIAKLVGKVESTNYSYFYRYIFSPTATGYTITITVIRKKRGKQETG